MEEAEALADTITIMAAGTIVCQGTTIELKRQYAIGYILKIETHDSGWKNKDKIITLVQTVIPNADIQVSF